MLFHEAFDSLHVEAVVHVGVPLQSRSEEVFVTEADFSRVLLILHVAVGESWKFAALPAEVSNVETVVERAEENESIHDDGPLVSVPPHCRVLGLNHFYNNQSKEIFRT